MSGVLAGCYCGEKRSANRLCLFSWQRCQQVHQDLLKIRSTFWWDNRSNDVMQHSRIARDYLTTLNPDVFVEAKIDWDSPYNLQRLLQGWTAQELLQLSPADQETTCQLAMLGLLGGRYHCLL